MSELITLQPLTAELFSTFGDVVEITGEPDIVINQGQCGRYHDLAQFDFMHGRAGLSIFNANARELPLKLDMVERHPEGSQAFIPMTEHPFVVIVAEDNNGTPGQIHAFKTAPGQGVNYFRNTWHGVLTPLFAPGHFAVIDRIGTTADAGPNLEEYWFDHEILITN